MCKPKHPAKYSNVLLPIFDEILNGSKTVLEVKFMI